MYDYGEISIFITDKTKREAADKTSEQGFLREFKATCKKLVNLSYNDKKQSQMHLGWLCSQPFKLFIISRAFYTKSLKCLTRNINYKMVKKSAEQCNEGAIIKIFHT